MDYLMSLNLSWTEWLLGAYIVLYGYMYGVRNTTYKVITPFTGGKWIQSKFGKITDLYGTSQSP